MDPKFTTFDELKNPTLNDDFIIFPVYSTSKENGLLLVIQCEQKLSKKKKRFTSVDQIILNYIGLTLTLTFDKILSNTKANE